MASFLGCGELLVSVDDFHHVLLCGVSWHVPLWLLWSICSGVSSLVPVSVGVLVGGFVNVDQSGLHSTLHSMDIVFHTQFRSLEFSLPVVSMKAMLSSVFLMSSQSYMGRWSYVENGHNPLYSSLYIVLLWTFLWCLSYLVSVVSGVVLSLPRCL